MSRILVTGATGFIGRPLVERLRSCGHTVVPIASREGDIAAPETLAPFAGQADAVIHLAGKTYVPDSWKEPAAFLRTNVLGTAQVLEYCRRERCRLVYVSAYVYGQPASLPIAEAAIPAPNNPYALSKYSAEQVCRFYVEHFAVPVTVLRPFNIFGPGQAAHFLIPALMAQVLRTPEIRVQDLGPRRDYIHVADLVRAIALAVERSERWQVYNVGAGISHSVGEIVALLQTAAGTRKPVVSEGVTRPNELMDVVADISLIRRELGWSPGMDLATGLQRAWEAEQEANERAVCPDKQG